MIIRELTLENFCCYYGENTFAYDSGLNMILGHNGDGKTTVITALKWIFDPLFVVKQEELVSAKKFAKAIEGDSFNVKVSLLVEQDDELINIEKGFTVSKTKSDMELTPITESSFINNNITGEGHFNPDTKRILNRIFPPEFRQFSIFEGETGTMKVIGGASLADLVRSFSSAKSFEELETAGKSIKNRAEKAYVSHSKADADTKRKIANFDNLIFQLDTDIKSLDTDIGKDEKGLQFYQDSLDELSKSSGLSEDMNRVNREIKDISDKKGSCQRALKIKYTDYLFDDFFILAGYEKFRTELSEKIDALRQAKDRVLQEKIAEQYEEDQRLSLVNGATPLPPGSPSEGHLKEALNDDICKVCNRPLDDHSRAYINKSLSIYAQNKELAQKSPKRIIFKNDFIGELALMDKSIEIHFFNNSYGAAKQKINELMSLNMRLETDIRKYIGQLEELEKEKKGIIDQTTASEEKLQDVVKNISEITHRMNSLYNQIARNNQRLESKIRERTDVLETKRRTMAQLPPSSFKEATIKVLDDVHQIFVNTKEREYEQYLSLLGIKATAILKKMNPGEITGNIKLVKTRTEVQTSSINDDGSERGSLDNSGALSISISMAILFAIADMAAEFTDEAYPMIFDAPTGRFSPDRKLAFYDAIYETGKQCIIVTLDFLGANNGEPYLIKDQFGSAKKHKAFWVKRSRPFEQDKKETIDTNIEVLPL